MEPEGTFYKRKTRAKEDSEGCGSSKQRQCKGEVQLDSRICTSLVALCNLDAHQALVSLIPRYLDLCLRLCNVGAVSNVLALASSRPCYMYLEKVREMDQESIHDL